MILTIDLINLQLKFRVLETPLAKLWADRMALRETWPLDDPCRFYGFNSPEQDQSLAMSKIQECIAKINSWNPLINQTLNTVYDQDTLNYLHSIFEQYHGLLDQHPHHLEYGPVPDHVIKQLANLNIAVHRCESSARGNRPRFVCTWFGMPKTQQLPLNLMQSHGTMNIKFGTVYLNYSEIGKTLEDLSQDRDNYVSDNAFRPFNYYSADFAVRMYDETAQEVSTRLSKMQEYYNQHRDFFFEQGYTTFEDPRLLPLRFPVAELIESVSRDQLLSEIAQQQHITKIQLQ